MFGGKHSVITSVKTTDLSLVQINNNREIWLLSAKRPFNFCNCACMPICKPLAWLECQDYKSEIRRTVSLYV